MSKTYSAGIVTAYGAAKRAGYQGTYEDFCRQQAGYAESAATVEHAKNTAVSAANTASTKASEATTAATAAQTAKTQTEQAASQALTDISTARTAAISAVQTEGATQTANATAQAQAAATSANTASTKASEATASATTATTKATEAAASATSAANAASAAQGVLESIPEDYSDLSEDVDKLKADLADVDNHTVKSAEQLISDKRTVDKVPYKYRASQSGKSDRAYDCIVGGTVCFNQIVKNMRGNSTENGLTFVKNNDTITISGTVTEAFDYNTVMFTNNKVNFKRDGSKYLLMLNKVIPFAWGVSGYGNVIPAGNRCGIWTNNSGGVWTNGLAFRVEVGQTVDIHELKASVFDLTKMFGTAIADHIYNLEQSQAGAGVALFRAMFPDDYYPYNVGSLVSVEGLSAHVMRDADNNIIGSYPLDSTLTLRGVLKLVGGKIEFDGDTYEANGAVTKRYAERAYQSGDESLANAITDGTNTVYKLSVETTETAIPYASPQIVAPYGTEEYISETVCPVGHITEYPDNLRAKIDGLPWDLSMIAPVETAYTATRNYTVNQLLIVYNTLYKVTSNIANGGTIVVGTNVVATTLSEVIASLS